MTKFTLIIPCYNEEKNIQKLATQISNLKRFVRFDTILVNNGSIDNTKIELESLKKKNKIKKLNIINIKKNIGFGNAVKKGVLKSKTKIICYTHADLQTDIKDVLKAFNIFNGCNDKNVLVKGLRKKRSLFDAFFTLAMSTLLSFIFRKKLFDIHGQPNLFNKKMLSNINYLPNDFSIDTYLMVIAKKKQFNIMRFDVFFRQRMHGVGNNEGLAQKILHSLRIILSSLNMLIYGKF